MARPPQTIEQVIGRLVRTASGCLEYPGKTDRFGYHRVSIGHRRFMLHRAVYEHLVAIIPAGHDLHHRCGNERCAEVTHLEPLLRREHTYVGATVVARNRVKTHCKNGHPLSGDNLRVYRGERICKECNHTNCRRSRQKAKDKRPRTHCRLGHALSPENTWIKSDGRRQCKICLAHGKRYGAAPR